MIKGGVFALVMAILGLAFVAAAMPSERFMPSRYEASLEPVRPGQAPSVTRAVFADGRLWLLSDAGELWTVREDVAGARKEQLPEPAFDLCAQDGRVMVVTGPRQRQPTWTLRRWTGSDWTVQGQVTSRGEGFVGAQCGADGVSVVTSRRLVDMRGRSPTESKLSQRIPGGLTSSITATPTMLFIGLNAGEFGGGLMRIDRRTGEVTTLKRNDSGDLCGGPLNPDCDPVNGVAPEPWKPECVAAAIGFVHIYSRGRIVEVCGDQIRSVYRQPCPPAPDQPHRSSDAQPRCAEAFFSLTTTGNRLTTVGTDGLHVIDQTGGARRASLPAFKDYGPFAVNFDSPQFVLALTEANERRSMSGATPLIVPR